MDRFLPAAKLIATLLVLASATHSQNASCSVSGRVRIEGKSAAGVAVLLEADGGKPVHQLFQDETDAEGRFRISGAPPGTHTLRVHAYAHVMVASDRHLPCGAKEVPRLPSPTQTVTVTNGAEVRADLVLDLAAKP